MLQSGGRSVYWTGRLLKHLLLFSVMFLVVFLAVSYNTISRHNNQHKTISINLFASIMNNISVSLNRTTSAANTSDHMTTYVNGTITTESEFMRRRSIAQDICTTTKRNSGSVHGVFTHESGVIYCFVPKAGCTFWKRVFTYLNNKMLNSSYNSPFEISRVDVHSRSSSYGVRYNKTQHGPQSYPIRLIVTRDPVSRMISSYLDKMYLPDFWRNMGVRFMQLARRLSIFQRRDTYPFNMFTRSGDQNRVSFLNHDINGQSLHNEGDIRRMHVEYGFLQGCDFLRRHFDDMSKLFNASNTREERLSTSYQTRCGKYLTFTEFVISTMSYPEPHWTPVSKLCNPCQFQSTHISRMETFTEDARVILSKMGMHHLLDNFDRVAQIDEELRMIIDYHFTKLHKNNINAFFSNCLTARELAFRLWNTFQWQGYIHPFVQYTIPTFTDVDQVKVDFLSQIWEAREAGLRNPEAMNKAKKDFTRKMVSSLPLKILQQLMHKFDLDYSMFEYKKVNREECDIAEY